MSISSDILVDCSANVFVVVHGGSQWHKWYIRARGGGHGAANFSKTNKINLYPLRSFSAFFCAQKYVYGQGSAL